MATLSIDSSSVAGSSSAVKGWHTFGKGSNGVNNYVDVTFPAFTVPGAVIGGRLIFHWDNSAGMWGFQTKLPAQITVNANTTTFDITGSKGDVKQEFSGFTDAGFTLRLAGQSGSASSTSKSLQDSTVKLEIGYEPEPGRMIIVRFDKQGGSGGTDSLVIISNQAIPDIMPPVRTGYIFAGYYSELTYTYQYWDASGTVIGTWASYTNATFYARWIPITYTVTYNGNGANGGSTTYSVHDYGQDKELTKNGFSRTGYDFLGWSTSKTETTPTYTNGQVVSNLTDTNGALITLYAVWKSTGYENEDLFIHNIYVAKLGGKEYWIVHAGNGLYKKQTNFSGAGELIGKLNDTASKMFVHDDKLFILNSGIYKYFDGVNFADVSSIATIPNTMEHSSPTALNGAKHPLNLLQSRRKNSFAQSTTPSTTFWLDLDEDEKKIGITGDVICKVTQTDASVITYTIPSYSSSITEVSINRSTGVVTFATAPPNLSGQTGVEIEFGIENPNKENIERCSFFGTLPSGNGVFYFFSGNVDKPNMDWTSYISDPTYFPAGREATYGISDKVIGYENYGKSLAVIKEDSTQLNIFLRSILQGNEITTDEVVFPMLPVSKGLGAVSSESHGYLNSEALILTRLGVYAFSPTANVDETAFKCRSKCINDMIIKDPDIDKAICTVWNNYFIACCNGRCYVLDGNQNKTYPNENNTSEFSYACTYWDNIPATCFYEYKSELYFGTADGRIMKFNAKDGIGRYVDDYQPELSTTSGNAITAAYFTKLDDDGNFMIYKNLNKKGSGLMLRPELRSGAKVLISTLDKTEELIKEAMIGFVDFDAFDFDNVNFDSTNKQKVVPFNHKEKKYIALQFGILNDLYDQGMGVLGIIKNYTITQKNVK